MKPVFAGITISDRAVGAFPLSVGTALAFESVFPPMQKPYDPERKVPNRVSLSDYDICYVNLSTLYRNMVSAMDKSVFTSAAIDDLVATLLDETGVIHSLFDTNGNGCVVKFYTADHERFHHKVKTNQHVSVNLREATTENQKHHALQEKKCLDALHTFTDAILHFKDNIETDQRQRALILTHRPYDLLSFNQFKQLDLLESNTGVLKPRYLWASKYHPFGEKNLSHLPFNKKLLLVFGDKVEIKPGHLSMRTAVYETSIQRKWVPTSTIEKIDLDLSLSIMDPALAAILKSYK